MSRLHLGRCAPSRAATRRHTVLRRLPTAVLAAALLLGPLAAGCGADRTPLAPAGAPGETAPPTSAPPAPPVGSAYRVLPPTGTLPWPQHAPDFTPEQYAEMLRRLHIANNFALYQASRQNDPSGMYLHSGLDVVVPNGTPIHAVQDGVVRHVVDAVEYYKSVYVEDASDSTRGWGYTHVDGFRVRVGDRVRQGTWLASVRFRGVEHVHLTRLRLLPGGSWRDWRTQVAAQPDTFFAYADTEPPRFEGPFRYQRNEADSAFARGADGSPPVVSGDVDVVVGLRDPGEHSRQGTNPIGDRLAVARLSYEIAPVQGGDTLRRLSLDLRTAELPLLVGADDSRIAQTIFAFYDLAYPNGQPNWSQTRTSFYVVTNAPPAGRTGVLALSDAAHAWRTTERGPDGAPRFPNGDYVVTVRAWDFKGNAAARSDTVRVRN